VSADGVVTALKAGSATITVASANGVAATCEVTVAAKIIPVAEVTLDRTSLELTEGDAATLTATVNPSDATDKTLTWTSSDSSVASVSATGEVKAQKAGSATIIVSSSNGKTAKCEVTVNAKVIEVVSVTLDQTKLDLTEGDTATLTATVNPSDATDKTLTWTSSDASVASVSANGEVKALKPGTVTITVSSSNGKTATCTVTVAKKIIAVTGIVLSNTELKLTEGESATLTAIVQPADATDKTLTWKSSDSSIATVSTTGEVKAIKAGTATITVSTTNGISASCKVTVESGVIAVAEVKLDKTSLEMTEGDTATLTATVNPSNATDKTVTWTSTDSSVASVSANGEVKAQKAGSTTIIASSSNGKTSKCEVTVNAKVIRMERILLDVEELSLEKGSTHQFTATVYPAETTSPELEWWSDDEGIAKVDRSGLVTMIGEGSTIVHVRSIRWPEIEATCRINVTDAVDGIIADDAPCDIYMSGGHLLKKAVPASEIRYLDRGIYIIRQGGKTTKLLK
ncbi:MAG: Ig-like domain-containing protein, partial [Muribaculaceae bacterium]|nr:Ig-like domain-containing protein [Muribaculaceae bacterium]